MNLIDIENNLNEYKNKVLDENTNQYQFEEIGIKLRLQSKIIRIIHSEKIIERLKNEKINEDIIMRSIGMDLDQIKAKLAQYKAELMKPDLTDSQYMQVTKQIDRLNTLLLVIEQENRIERIKNSQ